MACDSSATGTGTGNGTRINSSHSNCLWNALILFVAVSVVFAIGEMTLRLTWPFLTPVHLRYEFMPGVGMHPKPHSEARWTNTFDYWTVSRTNSLGFVDREPPSAERAAESCHVAIVGDSFVEALEVPIADKVQVRLERIAAERLADWDITTAAYGRRATGQVQQLPWWDKWIRHRQPKLVVLVAVDNDFVDNARHLPGSAHARLAEDGGITLAPPAATVWEGAEGWFLYNGCCRLGMRSLGFVWRIVPPTYSTVWLRTRSAAAGNRLAGGPQDSDSWGQGRDNPPFPANKSLPYDTLFSGFALDQWKETTRQSGALLVVLATTTIHNRRLSVLNTLAAARRIPVVSQGKHILHRGGEPSDARWPKDRHWSRQGHQWAAEALIEWLEANPEVCRR